MNQNDLVELYLESSWRPNLAITGAAGLPEMGNAGNVIRPSTEVRLSMRLSPTTDCHWANQKLVEILTKDVPYNAKVTAKIVNGGNGWC